MIVVLHPAEREVDAPLTRDTSLLRRAPRRVRRRRDVDGNAVARRRRRRSEAIERRLHHGVDLHHLGGILLGSDESLLKLVHRRTCGRADIAATYRALRHAALVVQREQVARALRVDAHVVPVARAELRVEARVEAGLEGLALERRLGAEHVRREGVRDRSDWNPV